MSNVWATVSTIVYLPRVFPPTDFRLEIRIALDSMDISDIIFVYFTGDI